MSNLFITSDTHYGHRKAAEEWRDLSVYPNGPGRKEVQWHNEFILDNHNNIVKSEDKVIFLGDIIFQQATYLDDIKLFNGVKILVIGNHEHSNISKYVPYFKEIYSSLNFVDDWILTHIPIHSSQLDERWKVNIHGHIHERTGIIEDSRYFNVNIEFHDYKPVELSNLREMIKRKQKGGWNEYETGIR